MKFIKAVFRNILFMTLLTCGIGLVLSQRSEAGNFWVNTDLYSYHLERDWDWNEKHNLINLEYITDSGYVVSGSSFINSFYDRSHAVELGRLWNYNSGVFYRTGLGLSYGYKAVYCDHRFVKTDPLDNFCDKKNKAYLGGGFSILATQSIGYHYNRTKISITLMGVDALICTIGFRI